MEGGKEMDIHSDTWRQYLQSRDSESSSASLIRRERDRECTLHLPKRHETESLSTFSPALLRLPAQTLACAFAGDKRPNRMLVFGVLQSGIVGDHCGLVVNSRFLRDAVNCGSQAQMHAAPVRREAIL